MCMHLCGEPTKFYVHIIKKRGKNDFLQFIIVVGDDIVLYRTKIKVIMKAE